MELKDGVEGQTAFLALHSVQLSSSGVPEHFWEELYKKLKHGVFDAGENFGLARIEQDEDDPPADPFCLWKVMVTCPDGLKASDRQNIYLVDHAWTFRPEQARNHLRTIPSLLDRMCALMDVSENEDSQDQKIEHVVKRLWKYAQTYSIGNPNLEAEEKVPIWYVMDEFGARIQHSDEPTVRVVPFFYMAEQATYSLMFPLTDLEEGDEVTRDFVEGCSENVVNRSALLLPWTSEFEDKYLPFIGLEQTEPSADYFSANRLNETLPNPDSVIPSLPTDRPIRVYVEYSFIRSHLQSPRFEQVENPDDAEILWLSSHFKDYKTFSEDLPHKRINQFPCEHVLTVKDLLCIVARRAHEGRRVDEETLSTRPIWLPTTFNLKTELAQFVAFYRARQAKGLDNLWIVKPWNLARSLDTHVTDQLDMIIRLSVSGPKVVQKYIERPVLFHRQDLDHRVKFDVRYIILLSSVNPLKAYAYKRFWLRFANKPFELDHFDEYERHFTVMNYTATTLHKMLCHDFIRQFEEQYPNQSWATVEGRIFEMLSELLQAATKGQAPSSIVNNPQSRAMYAVDLMLQWTDTPLSDDGGPWIQPQVLEINWAPDCKRACLYYPEFFDDVFSVLFLDETEGKNVHLL